MKVLLVLAAFFSSSALATTVGINKSTKVVKVEVETSYNHSCPGTLKLNYRYASGNIYNIDYNMDVLNRVNYLKSQLSNKCSDEISEIEKKEAGGPICLSYGRSSGTVFIKLSQWNQPKEITVTVPSKLRVKSITQLASVATAPALDCDNPPSIMCCMAEIPSCITCRENAAEKMRLWQVACLED